MWVNKIRGYIEPNSEPNNEQKLRSIKTYEQLLKALKTDRNDLDWGESIKLPNEFANKLIFEEIWWWKIVLEHLEWFNPTDDLILNLFKKAEAYGGKDSYYSVEDTFRKIISLREKLGKPIALFIIKNWWTEFLIKKLMYFECLDDECAEKIADKWLLHYTYDYLKGIAPHKYFKVDEKRWNDLIKISMKRKEEIDIRKKIVSAI